MSITLIFISIIFCIITVWFFLALIIELYISRNRYIQIEWTKNNKEKARNMLVKDILSAKKSIYILSGSIDKEIYDDEDVQDAFSEAARNEKIDIKILFSEKTTSSKKLPKLAASKERIQLIPLDIIPKTHFRIIDSQCIYMEKPHSDDIDGLREFRYIKNDPLAGHIFKEKFEKLIPN